MTVQASMVTMLRAGGLGFAAQELADEKMSNPTLTAPPDCKRKECMQLHTDILRYFATISGQIERDESSSQLRLQPAQISACVALGMGVLTSGGS